MTQGLTIDYSNTYLTEGERYAAIALPQLGVAWNVKKIWLLEVALEGLANNTVSGLKALQTEVDSLAEEMY